MKEPRFTKVTTSSMLLFRCAKCQIWQQSNTMERFLDNHRLGHVDVWCGRCVKKELQPDEKHSPLIIVAEERRKSRQVACTPVNAPVVAAVKEPEVVVPDINLVL